MTFLADGAPFTFPFGPGPVEEAIAVGWLDGTGIPIIGDVPTEFVAELRERCAHGTNVTRGRYPCPFCSSLEAAALVNGQSEFVGRHLLGNAEIYVGSEEGRWYAAPNLIVHYVERHSYRPPDEFIAAVLARTGDLALRLSPGMRRALARVLRIVDALQEGRPVVLRLPDNLVIDQAQLRQTVLLPLHGAPSKGDVVISQVDIGPLRDVLDHLDLVGDRGVSLLMLDANERRAVRTALARTSSP